MSENSAESEFAEYENIDEGDDTDPWEEDGSPATRQEPAISLDELLHKLTHEVSLPEPAELYALSDLSRPDANTVEKQWPQIPLDTRRALIEELVQVTDADMRFHLGRFLRIALADSDADIRRLAIEGLWEDDSSDLIGILTRILRIEESSEVRAAAAGALGSFVLAGELEELDASLAMRAEESLLSILRNEQEPIEVQSQALESIAYSGEIGVRQLIEDAYYSPFEDMRIAALNAMGRSADVRWRGLARAELENPSSAMRVSAAIACGELEARAAVEEIIGLLNDEEQAVRLAAVFSLGRLGGKTPRDALQSIAGSEFEVEAEAAEEALEEMLFYDGADDEPLLDESSDLDEGWDDEPWEGWSGRDDSDLGSYG